jgi:type IV pilus assembly protein PilQ
MDSLTVPENLRRRLDVTDFATPVTRIDTFIEDGGAVVEIRPEGNYDYIAYQSGSEFTVSVEQLTEQEAESRREDKFPYTGDKLSLNFQDIEVRSVLQLIADFTGLNLVASDTVSGSITLRLQNVPWDQALDLILKTKGLDKRQIGNVLLVAPADEIAARERLELETDKQIAELAPVRLDIIQVNYAKVCLLGSPDQHHQCSRNNRKTGRDSSSGNDMGCSCASGFHRSPDRSRPDQCGGRPWCSLGRRCL